MGAGFVRGTTGDVTSCSRNELRHAPRAIVPAAVPRLFRSVADWLFEPRLSRVEFAFAMLGVALLALPAGAVAAQLLLREARR